MYQDIRCTNSSLLNSFFPHFSFDFTILPVFLRFAGFCQNKRDDEREIDEKGGSQCGEILWHPMYSTK